MYPYIHLIGKEFPSYMLMGTMGFLAVLLVTRFGCRNRNDVDYTQIVHIALAAVGGLVIGGHVLYGIVNFKVFIIALKDGFSMIHSIWEFFIFIGTIFGGMVFYGGLIGAIIGLLWYIKAAKLPVQPYIDIFAFSVPLFHGFARIGCFLAGCCYGVESEFGFVFHDSILESANGVSRFPVQLLEAGLNFLLFGILFIMYQKKIMQNQLLYLYFIAYSVIRFFDEFLRGDTLRGFIGIFSTSQFISIILFFTAIMILIVKKWKKSKQYQTNIQLGGQ